MSPGTLSPGSHEEALHARESVDALRRASLASIVMLAVGLATVAATTLYAVSRLRPLERQVAEKAAELQALERDGQRLADRNAALQDSVQKAEELLGRTRGELQQAAAAGSPQVRSLARSALQTLAGQGADSAVVVTRTPDSVDPPASPALQAAIAGLFAERASARLQAYDRVVGEHADDPALVPALLAYGQAHQDNLNGIYNTLVVLSHLDRGKVAPYRDRVLFFAAAMEGKGDRIAARVRTLRSRLAPAAGAA
jgi:hypothetical protein